MKTRRANEPLRIAFYSPRTSHLEPALAHGGDPIFLDALFRALRDRGHDVRVVSRLNVRDLRRGHAPVRRFLEEALAIRKEMKRFSPHGWIAYNPSPTHPDLFGWWQRRARYIILGPDTWLSRRLRRQWRWLFAFAFRQSLRRATKVSASRPAIARRLSTLGATAEQVQVSPPAVPIPMDVPSRDEARRRMDLPMDAFVGLAVSRFTSAEQSESKERKTQILLNLLGVWREMPSDSILVIVGDGPGRSQIEGSIAELGVGERVRLAGAVDYSKLKWCFAACDVYAYPDLVDRPRLSFLDAQACGRPVVAMRTESAELLVDDGRTGLLAADIDEFREQLTTLAGDRARCEAMGQAARAYVAAVHSIDARARQIEEFLGAN
jgi:glycosyltransferase involved in cell wall biosynthesis